MKKCVTTAITLACLTLLLIVPGQASDCPDNMLVQYEVSTMAHNAVVYYECWDLNRNLDGYKITGSIHQSYSFEAVSERPDGNCKFSKTYTISGGNTSWEIKETKIVRDGKTLRVTLKRPFDPSKGMPISPMPGCY